MSGGGWRVVKEERKGREGVDFQEKETLWLLYVRKVAALQFGLKFSGARVASIENVPVSVSTDWTPCGVALG